MRPDTPGVRNSKAQVEGTGEALQPQVNPRQSLVVAMQPEGLDHHGDGAPACDQNAGNAVVILPGSGSGRHRLRCRDQLRIVVLHCLDGESSALR